MSNDAHAILIQTNGASWEQWSNIVQEIEQTVPDSQSLFLKDDWGEEHFYVYSSSLSTSDLFTKIRPLCQKTEVFSMVPACHVYHILPKSLL